MRPAAAGTLIVCALLGASDARAQRPPSNSHAIYMTAVEFKGSTITDKLAPPQVDPAKLAISDEELAHLFVGLQGRKLAGAHPVAVGAGDNGRQPVFHRARTAMGNGFSTR